MMMNDFDNIPKDHSTRFRERATTINDRLEQMYKTFETTYVAWKNHPENQEYQRALENIKNNIKTEMAAMSSLGEEVRKETTNNQQKMVVLERRMHREKRKARRMSAINAPLSDSAAASAVRLDDSTEEYKTAVIYNVCLGIGIIALLSATMKFGTASGSGSEGAAMTKKAAIAAFILFIAFIVIYVYAYNLKAYITYIILAIVVFGGIFMFFKRKAVAP